MQKRELKYNGEFRNEVEFLDQDGNIFVFRLEEHEVSRYRGDEMFLEYDFYPTTLLEVLNEDGEDITEQEEWEYKFV